jgi:hypothetical protein
LATGEWDVDGMLAGMSSPLLTEWLAYNRISPVPDFAQLFASLMAIVCNSAGRIYPKHISPDDFLPSAPRREQTPEEVYAIFAKLGVHPKPVATDTEGAA